MSDWTKESIKAGLQAHDEWVFKAIVRLYELQTEDEKCSETTKHTNGVGFTAFDATILTSFAKQINQWDKQKFAKPLSPKQIAMARKKILKYSGQLANIANSKGATQ